MIVVCVGNAMLGMVIGATYMSRVSKALERVLRGRSCVRVLFGKGGGGQKKMNRERATIFMSSRDEHRRARCLGSKRSCTVTLDTS